jgi:hypothetical protein
VQLPSCCACNGRGLQVSGQAQRAASKASNALREGRVLPLDVLGVRGCVSVGLCGTSEQGIKGSRSRARTAKKMTAQFRGLRLWFPCGSPEAASHHHPPPDPRPPHTAPGALQPPSILTARQAAAMRRTTPLDCFSSPAGAAAAADPLLHEALPATAAALVVRAARCVGCAAVVPLALQQPHHNCASTNSGPRCASPRGR